MSILAVQTDGEVPSALSHPSSVEKCGNDTEKGKDFGMQLSVWHIWSNKSDWLRDPNRRSLPLVGRGHN